MKNTLRILAAALVVASASVAQAQGGGGGGGGGGRQMDPAQMAERAKAQREALFAGITLTADQKTKIDSLYEANAKAQAEFRAAAQSMEPAARQEKMMSMRTEQQKAIKAVLTKEQAEVYDKNLAAMPQGRRGGF